MPISEFYEWMAHYQLEPFGHQVDNLRFGSVAASVFNSRRTRNSDKYYQPNDFALKFAGSDDMSATKRNLMGFYGWLVSQANKKAH